LLKNKKVPYTFPIFIDKRELNLDVLRIFSEDKTLTYREIIRKLLDKHRPDMTNYYLINWTFDNGIVINDFDYVDKFDYEMRDFQIYNVMNLPTHLH
jgi:CRISPR-associated protein Csh1